jgi:DNA-binding beta-propeller fold protein YncE
MTNQATNSILVFDRADNGALTSRGSFPTGGAGGQSPSGNPLDPLASENSLLLSNDNRLLFAVNAGSNTISVMSVSQNGLQQIDAKSSGGL